MRQPINSLSNLGDKILKFFGESNAQNSQYATLKDIIKADTMANLLPFEGFDLDNGLFINKHSIGFIIEAKPLVGADENQQKLLNSLCEDFFFEGASLQFLFLADHRIRPFLNWWSEGKREGIFNEIALQRQKHFEKGDFAARVFRFFLSYSVPYQTDFTKEAKHLCEIRQKMIPFFQSFTSANGTGPNVFLEVAGGMLNHKITPELKRRKHNILEELSAQLMMGGETRVEKDALYFDEEVCFKSFLITDTPPKWSPLAMQNLIGDQLRDSYRINHPFFLHYGVHFPNQSKAEKNFTNRARLIENQGKSNYLVRMIPELAGELRECDAVRREIVQGAKFVWTQLSCGFWAPKEEAIQAEQSIRNLFKANQFELTENRYTHLPHLISILPTVWGEMAQDLKKMNVLKTTLSTECPLFIPLQGEWTGTSSPGMLFLGRRGQLLNWNPFDNNAGSYNCIVVGRSGSGKSVFMQDMLLNGLRVGARVFILDVGRSYEKLCSLVGGQQIEFSRGSEICLNPFSNLIINDQEEKEAAFSFLKAIISCMVSPNQLTTHHENCLIETALHEVWKKHNNDTTMSHIAEFFLSQPNDKDKMLGVMLKPYTKDGVYAKYFEGKNNINFNNDFVLIELEELKGKKDLQAVILQLVIMTIANQAFLGDRKTPFYICIDEAWDLLRAPQTGEFIETLARRLRKYRGSLVVGTQSVEDFFTTPGAKAAFDNLDWGCFLSQKKSSIQLLAENGKLSRNPAMLSALESVTVKQGEYSEILLTDPNGNFSVARLILDPFSKLLYSTKAEDYAKIKDLTKQGYSVSESIQKLLIKEGER